MDVLMYMEFTTYYRNGFNQILVWSVNLTLPRKATRKERKKKLRTHFKNFKGLIRCEIIHLIKKSKSYKISDTNIGK